MQEERKLRAQQQSEGKTFIKTSRGKEIIAITVIVAASTIMVKLFSLLRF